MKATRAYKAGRPTDGWRKGEPIARLDQVQPGDICIMDSHRFRATNLIRIQTVQVLPRGFTYNYSTIDGRVILNPDMFTHDFELPSQHIAFFRAERITNMNKQAVMSGQVNGPRKDVRTLMLRKIHVEFPKLRPDLRHSTEELRDARLRFCEEVLGLRQPLRSMSRLNDKQLGRVIEAIKDQKRQPELRPGFTPTAEIEPATAQAEIIHLAGSEQVWAIEQAFIYLRWSPGYQEGFLQKRYNRSSPRMLSSKDATACLMILFNIAATRDIKSERGENFRVSRKMIGQYIPTLKRKLGIDQGKQH